MLLESNPPAHLSVGKECKPWRNRIRTMAYLAWEGEMLYLQSVALGSIKEHSTPILSRVCSLTIVPNRSTASCQFLSLIRHSSFTFSISLFSRVLHDYSYHTVIENIFVFSCFKNDASVKDEHLLSNTDNQGNPLVHW